MTNIDFMDKAAKTNADESCLRLIYSALFGILQYGIAKKRMKKPFNPILGESYEIVYSNFRFFSE